MAQILQLDLLSSSRERVVKHLFSWVLLKEYSFMEILFMEVEYIYHRFCNVLKNW